jgi:hypothetical protein
MQSLTFSSEAPRPLMVLTAVSVALAAMTLIWSFADPRLIDGVPVWAKPMKFAISLTVFFGTLALLDARLSPAWRDGRLLRGTTVVMATAMAFEMAYIIFMAARGEASHFNQSTPFTQAMYGLMGLGATLLVVGVAVYGVAAWRDTWADLGPALRMGVAVGFVGSTVLTLITALTLSAMSGHFIGTPGPDAATIPLLGWSAAVGDLRPSHFLALHMMQALPLAGLMFDRLEWSSRAVLVTAAAYAVITMAVYAQALAGMPLIRL